MTFFKDTTSKKPHLVWYQRNGNPVWKKPVTLYMWGLKCQRASNCR